MRLFVDFSVESCYVFDKTTAKCRAAMMAAPKRLRFRRTLSMPGLLKVIRARFERIPDPVRHRKSPLVDHLMAGMAIFFFKFPSMLAFDRRARGPEARPELVHNLKTLFGIGHVPCDTSLRERLDEVDPQALRPAFKAVFSEFQRGGGLEAMPTIDGRYLVSIDGTEHFCSRSIKCKRCSQRNLRSGETEYFHQMVCACLVAPGTPFVLPFMPEPVLKSDGAKKNDCESNAIRRLLPDIRREHPHLKLCVLMDGLHSKAPQTRLLRELGMSFIISAKHGDHKILYEQLAVDGETCEITSPNGTRHVFRWRNGAELNNSNRDLWVNVLEYRELVPERRVRKAGGEVRVEPARERTFGWITDIELRRDRLMEVMRAGRSRWKIENETFNTLKSFDNLEHSYGHGKNWLGSLMPTIMLLEYLVENVLNLCCQVHRAVRTTFHARTEMWKIMCAFILTSRLGGWEDLMRKAAPRLLWQRGPPAPAA